MHKIREIHAAEVLDSRGYPTVWAKVSTEEGVTGEAMVPSGASTGSKEAVELRDGGQVWAGKGVSGAIANIEDFLAPELIGLDVTDQRMIDQVMVDIDGSENKSRMGANAILALSMACSRAGANAHRLPLYRYLGGTRANTLPMPMLNILNGGAHADNSVDFQEFMIRPISALTFYDAMANSMSVYLQLKNILKEKKLLCGVGDEGGFAPSLKRDEEALDLIVEAIERAGFKPGEDFSLALDCAATELYENEKYIEKKKRSQEIHHEVRSAQEQSEFLAQLCKKYPIDSIEDGLDEEDWEGWKYLTELLGDQVQLVGDDLLVTNPIYLKKAYGRSVANSILIKLNQIGTVSQTLSVIELAQSIGYGVVISHRSGETEDTFIADLSVATGAGQIKTGAPCRSDRIAKYNRLLLIEQELGNYAQLKDGNSFLPINEM